MSVNAGGRKCRVWVCQPHQDESNGFEVTDYCTGDSGGFLTTTSEPMDDQGVIRASGSLVLAVPPNAPEFDPWEYPSYWAIGNHVLIKVADESGTLRSPKINHLYIISEPMPPYPGNMSLQLELGAIFVLKDGIKPESLLDENSGSTGLSRGVLAAELASQADMGFSAQFPEQNELYGYDADTQKPLIAAIGELALGAFSAIYQNDAGTATSTRINLKPDRRLFLHEVGKHDAADYEPLQSPLRPPSEVEVLTNETAADPEGEDPFSDDFGDGSDRPEDEDKQKYSGSFKTEELLSMGAIFEGGGETKIKAIIRTESWAWQGAKYQQTIEEQRSRNLVVPEDLFLHLIAQGRDLSYPGPYGRIDALASVETKVYESSDEGRLLTHTCEVAKCLGEVLAEWYKKNLLSNASLPSFFDRFTAEKVVTTFEYKRFDFGDDSGKDSQGQVRKIHTVKWLPKGLVAAAANDWIRSGISGPYIAGDPSELTPAEVTIETWRKRSKDEWEHKLQVFQAGQAQFGTIQAFLRLILVEGPTETSRNGNIRPPAAERRPADPGNNRRQPLQTARSAKAEVANTPERTRQVELNHTEGKEHAQALAEMLAKIDHYRHRGFRITTALRDEWFYWKPLSRIDLKLNGYIYWGLTDSVTFTYAANQAIVVADCMKIGRYPTSTDAYPYAPLPALLPEDPDPEPLPEPPVSVLYPEQANTQPFTPAVQMVYRFAARSRTNATFRQLLNPTGTLAASRVRFRSISRFTFFERFRALSRTRAQFRRPNLFRCLSRTNATFTVPEPDLAAWWKLNTENWTDSIGGYDLEPVSFGAKLVYDSINAFYAAEIDYDLDGTGYYDGSEYSYLQADASELRTRTVNSNWSWKIKFNVWFNPDNGDAGDPYQSQLLAMYDANDDYEFAIYAPSETSEFQVEVGSNGSSNGFATIGALSRGVWYEVQAEFDANTNELKAYLDGVLTDAQTISQPEATTSFGGTFKLGYYAPQECRFRQVKYYRSDLVLRS